MSGGIHIFLYEATSDLVLEQTVIDVLLRNKNRNIRVRTKSPFHLIYEKNMMKDLHCVFDRKIDRKIGCFVQRFGR